MNSYFDLDDKSPLIELSGKPGKFISRNLGESYSEKIQSHLENLISELEKRNFDVPDFKLGFFLNEKGEIQLWRIENFALSLKIMNDSILIKELDSSIYSDGSGSLQVYVGEDWESDKKEFIHGTMFHRAMNDKPRIGIPFSLYNHEFKSCSDSREHQPNTTDQTMYSTLEINERIEKYLDSIVNYTKLLKYPKTQINVFTEPEHIKIDLKFQSKMYGFQRSHETQEDALNPNLRLVSLSEYYPKDHRFAKILNDGFVYMELKSELPTHPTDSAQYNYRSDQGSIIEINLKYANSIFIIDTAIFQTLKDEWFSDNLERKNLPQEILEKFISSQLKSMIPINEYFGGYDTPIVISNRRILSDEIVHK